MIPEGSPGRIDGFVPFQKINFFFEILFIPGRLKKDGAAESEWFADAFTAGTKKNPKKKAETAAVKFGEHFAMKKRRSHGTAKTSLILHSGFLASLTAQTFTPGLIVS